MSTMPTMLRSQNGWTVLEDRPPYQRVPGTDVQLAVRPGDAGWLLLHFAAWFHRNVERLDGPNSEGAPDDWGWAYRPIRGQTSGFSNHASGTAEDLDAVDHPRGVKGTFTAAEKALIRQELVITYQGVIRWGEDYSGTIDGMHFEIVGSPEEVARVAAAIRAQEDQDNMQTSDVLKLGPSNSVTLGQPDGQITVGEALVTAAATGVRTNQLLAAQNALLGDLVAALESTRTPPAAGTPH